MRIVTYNTNGIRAATRKGLVDWLQSTRADIVCFQEIKADEVDIDKKLFEQLGYHTYWFSAQKKGYSGVGVLSKKKPLNFIKGNGYAQSDAEGRVLLLEYDAFYLISAYFPSGSSGDLRQQYKYQWLHEFNTYIKQLQDTVQKPLVICGDYNICHYPIDIHDPIRNATSSGFLPEERAWMTDFLNQRELVDSFRYLYPDQKDTYTWWSFRANARSNNKGWRIDYVCVSSILIPLLQKVDILDSANHSDHCPVCMDIGL